MPVNAKIKIEIITDNFEYEDWGSKDLGDPKTYQFILIAFGNGIIEEARVVGETKAGIIFFINLIERGGYTRGKTSDIKNAKFYQSGDACYPETSPFIFISPVAENGDKVNFEDYQNEIETFAKSFKSDSSTS